MEITERRHDEIMDNVKSQYVSDERHSRARAQSCTGLRFGKGSGTRHLTKISLRRLLNSARLKGFGPATVTLLVLLYCLVQVISISSRMAFAPCGRMVPTANGGKWIIRFSKGVSSRFWEDLVSLFLFFAEDIISVWNRNAFHHQVRLLFTRSFAIKRHLKLPHAYVMEYKPHDASLRDSSSYRNTWLRG
ncbi:hypothetical protein HID58_088834 [Brassica napus]|uniref:Uncharacterized protein n=1 Tax=Brassica napus TaxID=3708 RepID=A0ABQ7XXB4_BRANA|nr:hypothetical protein HID58_088834 [Brassica napus]